MHAASKYSRNCTAGCIPSEGTGAGNSPSTWASNKIPPQVKRTFRFALPEKTLNRTTCALDETRVEFHRKTHRACKHAKWPESLVCRRARQKANPQPTWDLILHLVNVVNLQKKKCQHPLEWAVRRGSTRSDSTTAQGEDNPSCQVESRAIQSRKQLSACRRPKSKKPRTTSATALNVDELVT